jgi:hypothetical protein
VGDVLRAMNVATMMGSKATRRDKFWVVDFLLELLASKRVTNSPVMTTSHPKTMDYSNISYVFH